MGDAFSLEGGDPLATDATELRALAAIEVRQRYPKFFADNVPLPHNEPLGPRRAFLSARSRDGAAVVCGAFRPLKDPPDPTTAEVRRMFARSEWRPRGVGRTLLLALERAAIEFGFAALRIATGHRQPEAIALYDGFADRRIAPHGPYDGDPTGMCFEKLLQR